MERMPGRQAGTRTARQTQGAPKAPCSLALVCPGLAVGHDLRPLHEAVLSWRQANRHRIDVGPTAGSG